MGTEHMVDCRLKLFVQRESEDLTRANVPAVDTKWVWTVRVHLECAHLEYAHLEHDHLEHGYAMMEIANLHKLGNQRVAEMDCTFQQSQENRWVAHTVAVLLAVRQVLVEA